MAADLREKAEELRRLKRHRETVGVDLYNVQQQLAKQQMQLENAHSTFQETVRVADEGMRGIRACDVSPVASQSSCVHSMPMPACLSAYGCDRRRTGPARTRS